MSPSVSLPRQLLAPLLILFFPGSIIAAPETPLVAIAPAVLLKKAYGNDEPEKSGAPLAERLQIALQVDSSLALRFVERGEIDPLLREQGLALGGATESASDALRAGRLLSADWILRLRLNAKSPARPSLEAEVIDALRADLLAREERPLEWPPNESWLLLPSDDVTALASDIASHALKAAEARASTLVGKSRLAPLVFINRSGTDRLAPLSSKLLTALGSTDHPGARALNYDSPEESREESLLFQAGLTDLPAEKWRGLADAYLWGEFREDDRYSGPAAQVPCSLRLWLWTGGEPRMLELTGTVGALDVLAAQAAKVALDATAEARFDTSLSIRRTVADRLLETLAVEEKNTPVDTTAAGAEAAWLRRDRRAIAYIGLAAFFAPEDPTLAERLLRLRIRLAHGEKDRVAQTRWTRAYWTHVDRNFTRADGRADFGLIARSAEVDPTAPGLGPRFQRIGDAWRGAAIDAAAAAHLWERFLAACKKLPDEPGLPQAVEALWPTVRRLDPELDPGAFNQPIEKREALAAIYRGDPPRLHRLLNGQLIPVVAPSAPPESSAASASSVTAMASRAPTRSAVSSTATAPGASTPRVAPASPKPASSAPASLPRTPARFVLAGAEVPSFAQQILALPPQKSGARAPGDFESLAQRARSGPLVDAPELEVDLTSVEFSQFTGTGSLEERLPPPTHHLKTAALGSNSLWIAFAPGYGMDWRPDRLVARIDRAPPSLSWQSPGSADSSAAPADLWLENSEQLWIATRGQGIRILDLRSGEETRVDSRQGLRADEVLALVRGHEAVFATKDISPSASVATRVDLRTRAITQVGADSAPDIASLPSVARAAINSFPDDLARKVVLPDTPALAWSAETSAAPAGPAAASLLQHRWVASLGSSESKNDMAKARLFCSTGVRDGLWVATPRQVFWASGSRRRPLSEWLASEIMALADDGRRLFILVNSLPHSEFERAREVGVQGAVLRLYVYDHQEGRWLGWLPRERQDLLIAGAGRFAFLRDPRSPFTLADSATLRPAVISASAETSAKEPPPRRPQADATRSKLRERLVTAIERRPPELEEVRRALADGADPAETDRYTSRSPLTYAMDGKAFDAIKLMLAHVTPEALNSQARDNKGRPLGHQLTLDLLKEGRADLVRRLLEAGYDAKPVPADFDSFTPTWVNLAVDCGAADLVTRFLQAGHPLRDPIHRHPQRVAIAQRNPELLAVLLDARLPDGTRLSPDSSSGDGLTPLFVAADIGWAEGVRLLLAAGAADFAGDRFGCRSLRDAAAPWPEVSVLLNQRPGAPDNHLAGALAVASIWNHKEGPPTAPSITSEILRYRDGDGWTVLHHAARQGRADFVDRLLKAGAPIDALTSAGESALCLAIYGADEKTIDLLLAARADPNRRADQGWAPLHAAAYAGRPDLVRRLLAAGAKPTGRVGAGQWPVLLLAATTANDETSIRLLVEAGASLHETDAEGYGPLEAAVVSDSPTKIQYLLDRDAHWQRSPGPDYHPMDAAAKRGLTRSIRKLQQLGLQSPRALSLAKNDATRALLQADDSPAGRFRLLNEERWPAVLAEPAPARRLERVLGHLAAGADPSHLSIAWGTPLDLAVATGDVDLVRTLVERGANPSIKSTGIAGDRLRPRTSLQGWLTGPAPRHDRDVSSSADRDEIALAYLPLFWPHEPHAELRREMLQLAERSGLPRAASWMRQNLNAPSL